jgi:hypothetical protein
MTRLPRPVTSNHGPCFLQSKDRHRFRIKPATFWSAQAPGRWRSAALNARYPLASIKSVNMRKSLDVSVAIQGETSRRLR